MWIFGGKTQKRGATFKGEGSNHSWMKLWYRGKEVPINKVFNLTHKRKYEENHGSYHSHCRYRETVFLREVLRSTLMRGHMGSAKGDPELGKKWSY